MSPITILFSGRLEHRKGLSDIKALSDYLETRDGYCLRIACNNKDNTALFAGNKKTRVFTALTLEQMPAFYRSGDIFYFPTKYEGFSMATLEALSCGLPVIGTAFAIPEELRGYDCTAIVEPASPEELLPHISALVEKCRTRRDEIHEQVARDFGRGQYEGKLLALLRAAQGAGAERKTVVIVSLNGIKNSGGVERVCYYLNDIARKYYPVTILEKSNHSFGKLDALIQPLLLSLRLCFMKNKLVISNSWQSFLYPADFSIHHGTTAGYCRRIGAMSTGAAAELAALYGADQGKIIVLNNFVDERIFCP